MYDLSKKLRRYQRDGFDLINVSGLLYHVFSPLMVLAGIRPLLRRGGLMIVSTNVVTTDTVGMEFNDGGRLQDETNTFWYLSVKALDYMLRYLKLAPVDCLFVPHEEIRSTVRYVTNVPSGYLSVICRASDDVVADTDDGWMKKSSRESWEYRDLVDSALLQRQPVSTVGYHGGRHSEHMRDDRSLDLWKAVRGLPHVRRVQDPRDSHTLRLDDDS
jgi:hypothetical protein